ncbi:MAG: glycosyltransferase [Candidatus Omnitrophica bacterium]|nr:glycosyltransferase [Candidatus Omnitrophota bacterium]
MRIKIYGGPLSISYNLAKVLHGKNADVTLFIDKTQIDDSYSPAWEDEDIDLASQDWIEEVNLRFNRCILKGKREKEFLKELRESDVLHMYGESSIWASFTDIPYVYNSYGFDLDQMLFGRKGFKGRMLSCLLRRSLLKAKSIIAFPHQYKMLKKMELNTKINYIPCPIDTEKYNNKETSLEDELKKRSNYDFIFFSPSRHEWTHTHKSNKGNDKLIRAFKKYIETSSKRALLILVEKGDDLMKTKLLLREYLLEEHVMWIKPQKKNELINFYNASDIVFDQFTLGGFGQTFLESMSCGKPTFIYLTKDYRDLYEEAPPCINVSGENEILEKLLEYTRDKKMREDIGRASREWVMKYHDFKVSAENYINLYNRISR